MSRNVLYAAGNAALFVAFLSISQPIWFLFLVLAIYYGYQAVKKPKGQSPPANTSAPQGVLGAYDVDGDGDHALGLYMQLRGHPVFVDLREDEFLEARKQHALYLFANRQALEESLQHYLERNPGLADNDVAIIGSHSPDVTQCEVFWEPRGHTSLNRLVFED